MVINLVYSSTRAPCCLSECSFFLGHVSAIAPTQNIQENAPVGLTRVAISLKSMRRDPSHQGSSHLIPAQMTPNPLRNTEQRKALPSLLWDKAGAEKGCEGAEFPLFTRNQGSRQDLILLLRF